MWSNIKIDHGDCMMGTGKVRHMAVSTVTYIFKILQCKGFFQLAMMMNLAWNKNALKAGCKTYIQNTLNAFFGAITDRKSVVRERVSSPV